MSSVYLLRLMDFGEKVAALMTRKCSNANTE